MTRELDREVAEKLMGYQLIRHGTPPSMHWDLYIGGDIEPIPDYSSSIEDAWLVVEQMTQDEWEFDLNYFYPAGTKDAPWCLAVFSKGWLGVPLRHEGGGFSAPEAICRAALVAMEVKA